MQERIYKNFSWLALLTLGIASVVIYLPAISAPLVFDDQFTIITNEGLAQWDYWLHYSWLHLLNNLDTVFAKNIFRPVLFISLALNQYLLGQSPEGFRAINLVIHAINTILVFVVVRRGFEGIRFSPASPVWTPILAAAFVAATFAVHPVQSEPVIYISARSSSLSLMFMLIAWLLIERVLVREATGQAGLLRTIFRYTAAVLCTGVAVLSKESAVILPVILFIYDRWIITPQTIAATDEPDVRARSLRQSILFVSPFAIVAILFAAFRLSVLGVTEALEVRPGDFHLLATNLKAYWHYFWLWLAPISLSIDHDFVYEHSLLNWRSLAAATGLLLVLWWAWKRRQSAPLTAFAVMGTIISLIPTTGITPLQDILVENRMYGGTIFIALIVLQMIRFFWDVGETRARVWTVAAAIAVLSLWIWRIEVRMRDWNSALTLWEATSRVSGTKSRVHYNLGVAYLDAGRDEKAMEEFSRAIELDPNNDSARLNLATLAISVAFKMTLWDERSVKRMEHYLQLARTELRYLADRGYKRPEAFYNLADSYRLENQPREALYFALEAVRADPERGPSYDLLGRIYEMYAIDPEVIREYDPGRWQSRKDWLNEKERLTAEYHKYYDQAFDAYTQALELGVPNRVEVMKLQARAKLRSGDPEEAERLMYGVINESADDPRSHFMMGTILDARNRTHLARDYYRTAIQIDPTFADAHFRLARLLEKERDYAGAEAHYRNAQNFDSRYQKAWFEFQKLLTTAEIDITPRFRPPR